jgi:hypothetical protein
MKKVKLNWIYRSLLTIIMLLLVGSYSRAQELNTTIEKTATIKDNITIRSTNSSSKLVIKSWNKNEIRVIYNIEAKGKNEEDIKIFKAELEKKLELAFSKPHEKSIYIDFPYKTATFSKDKVIIKFQKGQKKHELNNFKLNIVVFAPENNPLFIIDHFGQLSIESRKSDVTLILHSTEFSMGDCKSLYLNSSFSKNIKIGKINNADITINSGGLNVNSIENNLTLNANFSNVEFLKIGGNADLKLSSSTFKTSDIKELTLEGSFIRRFTVNNVEKAIIEKFSSSEFRANNINNLQIENSSFSTFRIAQVGNLLIEKSSSSKFYVKAANVVEAPQCSFTDFSISQLKKRFVIKSSSGSIKLDNVTTGFEKISIDGQFVNIDINTQENASYKIEAELEFPNYRFHDITYSLKEKNLSNEKMSGIRGPDKNTNSKIDFDCKSCSITLD